MRFQLFFALIILSLGAAAQGGNVLLNQEENQFENEGGVEHVPDSSDVVEGEEKNPLPSDDIKNKEGEESAEDEESISNLKYNEILKEIYKIREKLEVKEVTIGKLEPYSFDNVPVQIQMSEDDYHELKFKMKNLPEYKSKVDDLKKQRREKKEQLIQLKELNTIDSENDKGPLFKQLKSNIKEIEEELIEKESFIADFESIVLSESCCERIEKKTIDSIRVVSEHGYISEIRAYLKENKNGQEVTVSLAHMYPASVINFNTLRWENKFLISENPNFKYRICLMDLLNYVPYKNRLYPEKDEHVFRKTEKETHTKKFNRSYNLGNIIQGRIYSDANGVINDRFFGIIQTELKMRVQMNTQNLNWKIWRWNLGNLVPFNHAQIKLNTTKFDSQFDTLNILNYEDRINATALVSRSYRQLNFEATALHYQNFIHFDLRGGYQLNSTRIRSKTDTVGGYSANIHSISIEPRWEVPIRLGEWMLEVSPKFLWIQSMNNTGPNFKGVKAGIFNPEVVLNYHPNIEKQNGFYFRWVLFDNINYDEDDVMFWQVGYKVTFNELLKGSESENKD